MLIAKITDNGIAVANHTEMLPDTSFGSAGPTRAQIEELGFLQVTVWKPHDQATEKLVAVAPYEEAGEVFTVAVEPLTEEELESRKQTLAAQIRAQRASLLASCDWTQLADAPVNKAAWAEYRQALRDISKQEGFPETVEWPISP